MKILSVVGARPQFIKAAPLIRALEECPIDGVSPLRHVLIHTGQHYDYQMSQVFFDQLRIPPPDYHLAVGSGSHGKQTGVMLERIEGVLLAEQPDVVVVFGDTNTTLAGALAAYKLHIPVAHVEAGYREYVWRPEEINKIVADQCSDYLFCGTRQAEMNLVREGFAPQKIHVTGDITYDAYLMAESMAKQQTPKTDEHNPYVLFTLHRAESVDNEAELKRILNAVLELRTPVVFPVHPRTDAKLKEFGLREALDSQDCVRVLPPLGYLDFLRVLLGASAVFTDSGGVTKEAYYAGKPCLILDCSTEYTEILATGAALLCGKTSSLGDSLARVQASHQASARQANPFGDGKSASRMAAILTGRSAS